MALQPIEDQGLRIDCTPDFQLYVDRGESDAWLAHRFSFCWFSSLRLQLQTSNYSKFLKILSCIDLVYWPEIPLPGGTESAPCPSAAAHALNRVNTGPVRVLALSKLVWNDVIPHIYIEKCEDCPSHEHTEQVHFSFKSPCACTRVAQGAIHKLRHTNFMIFLTLPVLFTGGHISETPLV